MTTGSLLHNIREFSDAMRRFLADKEISQERVELFGLAQRDNPMFSSEMIYNSFRAIFGDNPSSYTDHVEVATQNPIDQEFQLIDYTHPYLLDNSSITSLMQEAISSSSCNPNNSKDKSQENNEYKEDVFAAFFESNSQKRVAVIPAGNIPLVGFSDLFTPLFCGFKVVVKPSSKDSVLMSYVLNKMLEYIPEFCGKVDICSSHSSLASYIKTSLCSGVIFSGSTRTISAIEDYSINIPLLSRGSKFSYGVVGNEYITLSDSEKREFILRLLNDIFLYYGLGCRSISYLLVDNQSYNNGFIDDFISVAKEHWCDILCRNEAFSNSYKHLKAQVIMEFGNSFSESHPYRDSGTFLIHQTTSVFPPMGALNFSTYSSQKELDDFLITYREQIQKKYSNFGYAQFPIITDWQDGLSTVEFLSKL